MNQLRRTKRIFVFLLAFAVAVSEPLVLSSYATDNISEKQSETEKKLSDAQSKKNAAQDVVDDLKEDADEAKEELDEATAELDALFAQIDAADAQITETEAGIADLQQQLEDAKAKKDAQYELMKQRIAYNYESTAGQTLFTAFLESGSFSDFLNRLDYMYAAAEYDRKVISDYETIVAQIEEKTEELSASKQDLEGFQADLAASQTALDVALGVASVNYSEKSGKVATAQDAVDAYDAQIADLQNQMASLEKQQAAAQAALAKQMMAQQQAELAAAEQAAAQAAAEQQAAAQAAVDAQAEEAYQKAVTDAQASGADAPDHDSYVAQYKDEHPVEQQATATVTLPTEDTSGAVSASESDVILLAATIQAEAGNQSYEGKLAVGSVIMNRVKSKSFPNTIYGVVSQKNQFEPWRKGIITQLINAGPNSTCMSVAREVIAGKRNGSWLFFMTPYWANYYGITGYQTIGGHAFFWKWGAN